MKRALIGVGALLLVLAIVAGSFLYSAFAHNLPIVDGSEIAKGVETVKDGIVSAFIVDVMPGKVALIDAGRDESGKSILAALSRRGLGPSSVMAIFLTHGHPDHMAACKKFPGAQVYALKSELAQIGDAVKVTNPLDDGNLTRLGDTVFQVFAVPGHTPGSAAYFARGVLFFGDAARGGKDGTVMPAVRFMSKDPDQSVASLKALEARLQPHASDVRVLAFAHSGPLEGFEPLSAFARAH
jgi:glyoxylase-like metal-dependent hydrolase (beta-lactamase superfamily II)